MDREIEGDSGRLYLIHLDVLGNDILRTTEIRRIGDNAADSCGQFLIELNGVLFCVSGWELIYAILKEGMLVIGKEELRINGEKSGPQFPHALEEEVVALWARESEVLVFERNFIDKLVAERFNE